MSYDNTNLTNMKLLLSLIVIICFSLFLGFSQQKLENQKMNTALILIDIQNDYFENGTMTLVGAEQACLNARHILDKFRSEAFQLFIFSILQQVQRRPFFFLRQKVRKFMRM